MALIPRRERAIRVALPKTITFPIEFVKNNPEYSYHDFLNLQAPARQDGNSYPRQATATSNSFSARVGRSTAWSWAHGMRHAWITSRVPDVSLHERQGDTCMPSGRSSRPS